MKKKRKLTLAQKKAQEKKPSIWVKIFRFFVPKNWKLEMYKGRMAGEQIRQGKISPKVVPTWWLGRLFRKIVDPKHKMKVGSQRRKK